MAPANCWSDDKPGLLMVDESERCYMKGILRGVLPGFVLLALSACIAVGFGSAEEPTISAEGLRIPFEPVGH
jgi:hypothetical protein